MLLAAYTFGDVLWSMLIFFAWVIWFWLLITVFSDLFRRHDTSGGMKVLWVIFVIVLPYLGVFIYLIAESKGMAERNMQMVQAQQAQMDDYVKSVASTGQSGRADRQGEGTARQRRDHAGRVRRTQAKGTRLAAS